ncbi:Cytoplasmic tRNA 2-thiolation protein 1 [Hibiscus syriacus]|uniref:Cytoplasmic tRNA 2-thiolation protein 1 n=1 Tax=Hibiscus syriacus TaxID=106335 RepID=A0A6A2WDL3_HIBSY|nr:Cytoplasmic tRNA 2-thiolation protein 1 [Hibiscus syriacus]
MVQHWSVVLQPFPLQTNSLFSSSSSPSNALNVGPIGIGNAQRNINIHIHAGRCTTLAPVVSAVGNRTSNGEGVQGECINNASSGPMRVLPMRNIIAAAGPAHSTGVVSSVAQSAPIDSFLPSALVEVNSRLPDLVSNVQGKSQVVSDSAVLHQAYGNDAGTEQPDNMTASRAGDSSVALPTIHETKKQQHAEHSNNVTKSGKSLKDVSTGTVGCLPSSSGKIMLLTSPSSSADRLGDDASSSNHGVQSSRSSGVQTSDDQLDVANAVSQVLESPAINGLLAGVSEQTGIGSPDVLRNKLQQLTQSPQIMNTVNQLAQQALSQGASAPPPFHAVEPKPQVHHDGRKSNAANKPLDRNFRIEQFNSPCDVFHAVAENAVQVHGNGRNAELLSELCGDEDLAKKVLPTPNAVLSQHLSFMEADTKPKKPGARLCCVCNQQRAALKRPKTLEQICRECFYAVFEEEIHQVILENKLFKPGERIAIGASGGKGYSLYSIRYKIVPWLKICRECFYAVFEEEIHQVILENKLFKPGERIAIGASGGKDSTVLAYVLSELNRRHNYGLDLFLLSIDEGITGYRDDSLETVKRNELQYGLPLKIVSYKDLYGWTMDEIVKMIGLKNNCTFCGVFRRQALDRGAALLNVDKVATGHNADDIAETVLLNILRGDIARLSRCTSIITGEDGPIPRCKPFKYTSQSFHLVAKTLTSSPRIYSPNAYRGFAREFIKDLERIRPRAILDIIKSGEDFRIATSTKMPEQGSCERCGYISSQKWCKACVLLEGLNRGLPKLGIGRNQGLNKDAKKDIKKDGRTKSMESKQCGSLEF